MKNNIPQRLSVNEIIDNFKELKNFRFDSDISKLLNIKAQAIAQCRQRESPTILFPIMDYLVTNNIEEIEKIFYKVEI